MLLISKQPGRLILSILSTLCVSVGLLVSCGLPDVVPQINKPSVKTISTSIYTLSSLDTKPDGTQYGIYGLGIYYKIYKQVDGSNRFEADYQTISNASGSPDTVLSQNGFYRLARVTSTGSAENNLPTFAITNTPNQSWDVTLDFSTGAKETVDIALGTIISSNSFQYYRFISPQSKKGFSIASLDKALDSDLALYRSDAAFNPANACYGVICYTYAQDYDWSYLPMYSAPVKLGTFDIH